MFASTPHLTPFHLGGFIQQFYALYSHGSGGTLRKAASSPLHKLHVTKEVVQNSNTGGGGPMLLFHLPFLLPTYSYT